MRNDQTAAKKQPTPVTNTPLTERLQSLREYFSSNSGSLPLNGASGISAEEFLSYAEQLFQRAPVDFLRRSSVATLAQITAESVSALHSHTKSKEPYSISIREHAADSERGAFTSINTVIADRPFVVDSLLELVREQGRVSHCLLHPIFEFEGRGVSLVYLELDRFETSEERLSFQDELERVFEQLILVTEDYEQMRRELESIQEYFSSAPEDAEYKSFLHWLIDGGFVFLGCERWSVEGPVTSADDFAKAKFELGLGVLKKDAKAQNVLLEDVRYLLKQQSPAAVTKSLIRSSVHRRTLMDVITLRTYSADTNRTQIICAVGMFTSRAVAQDVSTVPIIRQIVNAVIEAEGYKPNSHDLKELLSTAGTMLKSHLFQSDPPALREDLAVLLGIDQRRVTRMRLRYDRLFRFVSLLIVMPRERFSESARIRIQRFLGTELGLPAEQAEYRITASEDNAIAIQFLIPNPSQQPLTNNVEELEGKIAVLTRSWREHLEYAFAPRLGWKAAREISNEYFRLFPKQYRATSQAEEVVRDIEILQQIDGDHPLRVSIEAAETSGNYVLKLFKRGAEMTLSQIVPFLENVGFEVVDESLTNLRSNDSTNIYAFRVRTRSGAALDLSQGREVLLDGISAVLMGQAENDALNSLLVAPGLSVRQISILRALTRYVWQIRLFASKQYVFDALALYPESTAKLFELFALRFDPARFSSPEARRAEFSKLRESFIASLKNVRVLVHDRVLRAVLNIIESIVRTNFYQQPQRAAVAFKIDCEKVNGLPTPKPLFETFVNSPEFEGLHLRGGKVARGGLRWSERPEDYRTEVLGLMKTQMIKNSIIIPVGAKGGFVVKNLSSDPKEIGPQVEGCYRKFIRSLLELADNRVDDKVSQPVNTVIYDAEDPYLVVAADKGTSTFSDIANEIAVKEFNFWLGDAFASGGSYGYDHKKLGITARGGWEASLRHFREIGIDPEQQDFTAVGIGDMAGDVFGNGLIRSKHTKLIAAFNHKHIFIDPNPNPATSFDERKRLFDLPRSQWSDYNTALISQGGGIFLRADKEIPLSPEVRAALGTDAEILSGQELIRAILKAPVDLLWNGGIGTYIKSAEEDNIYVGDPTNDDVRINGSELRVKIISEGGNLGVTQRGRIEFAMCGGHINTDAVDNSGGVDTSDAEVNLKILLSAPMKRKELSFEERNQLLTSVADQVCEKVIGRNHSQSKVLSLGVFRSQRNIGYYAGLIPALEAEKLLDRKGLNLPTDEELLQRGADRTGLTRPELAILIAYVKISLCNTIIDSALPEEPFLEQYLLHYFPLSVVVRFPEDTKRHPLRREIIATQVANTLVERMGASFVYRLAEELGAPRTDIISAYLVAESIIDAVTLTKKLRSLDTSRTLKEYYSALNRISEALDGMTRWILAHRDPQMSWTQFVARYQKSFATLTEKSEALLSQAEQEILAARKAELVAGGLSAELARNVLSLGFAVSFLDMIEAATVTKSDVIAVAHLYSGFTSALECIPLLQRALEIEPKDRWEALAQRTLSSEIRDSLGDMTVTAIREGGTESADSVQQYLEKRREIFNRYQTNLREYQTQPVGIATLLVLSNQLQALARGIS